MQRYSDKYQVPERPPTTLAIAAPRLDRSPAVRASNGGATVEYALSVVKTTTTTTTTTTASAPQHQQHLQHQVGHHHQLVVVTPEPAVLVNPRTSNVLAALLITAVVVTALATIIVILVVPAPSVYGSATPSGYSSNSGSKYSSTVPEEDWRAQLLALVNQARSQNGAPALCYNDKLNRASQSQSDSRVFGHTWTWVAALNYDHRYLGQNIAMGQTSVQQVFSAWFNEMAPNDGHRQNILNPAFTQMGAGWATSNNQWTQNFGSSSAEACA